MPKKKVIDQKIIEDKHIDEQKDMLTRSQKKRQASININNLEDEISVSNTSSKKVRLSSPKPNSKSSNTTKSQSRSSLTQSNNNLAINTKINPKNMPDNDVILQESPEGKPILEKVSNPSKSKASEKRANKTKNSAYNASHTTYNNSNNNNKTTTKTIEEEFRMLEELMSTENRYTTSLKYKQLILDLKTNDDIKILDAISQLSTQLSLAQEDTLPSFQLETLIPELFNCLQRNSTPDIMLNASVCITHILDILPLACKIIVNHGGVEILCQKMQNFDYIDVAENAIKALEKISSEYGITIIKAGGLKILMMMIDFFVSSTQKSIINIILNILRIIPDEDILNNDILPMLPNLVSYLDNNNNNTIDETKYELLCVMFSRLTDRIIKLVNNDYDKKQKYLEIITKENIITKLCGILNHTLQNFNTNKLHLIENIFRGFNKFCYYSSKLCLEAFQAGLIDILAKVFNIIESNPSKDNQLANLAYETVSLMNSILALRAAPFPLIGKIAAIIGIKIMDNQRVIERINLFNMHKNLLILMIEKLANRLPIIFEYNAGSLFKYLSLICFEKMISFTEEKDLCQSLNINHLALFVSRLMHSHDIMIVALTVQIIGILLIKIPMIYTLLGREGVIQYLKALSSDEKEVRKLEFIVINQKKNGSQPFRNFNYLVQKPPSSAPFFHSLNNMENTQRFDAIFHQLKNLGSNYDIIWNSNQSTNGPSTQSGGSYNYDPPSTYGKIFGQSKDNMSYDRSSNNDSNSLTINNFDIKDELSLSTNDKVKKDFLIFKSQIQQLDSDQGSFIKDNNGGGGEANSDQIIMDIENESKSNTFIKNNNNSESDKIDSIRRELYIYIMDTCMNIQQIAKNNNIDCELPNRILINIKDISNNFLKGQQNSSEYGVNLFSNYCKFINQYNHVTKYEILSSKLLKNVLNFILDSILIQTSTLSSKLTPSLSSSIASKSKNKIESIKLSTKSKNNSSQNSKEHNSSCSIDKQSNEKGQNNIEITDQQYKMIFSRILIFLSIFKQPISSNPQINYLKSLLTNIQDMLADSNSFIKEASIHQTVPVENDHSLISDLKFLATRIKFKAQFIPHPIDFGLQKPNLTKSKSLKMEENENFIGTFSHDFQMDLYAHKEAILKEVPVLVLSVEQFGTLDVIEEYLLNKLTTRDDLYSIGGYSGYRKHSSKEYYKFEDNRSKKAFGSKQDNSIDDNDMIEEDDQSGSNSNEEQDYSQSFKNQSKSTMISSKILANTKNSVSFGGGLSISKLDTIPKGKYKSDKNKFFDRLNDKDFNFKKHLEIKFFKNGQELNKNRTIYDICTHYKNNQDNQQLSYSDDTLIVEYKLYPKNNNYGVTINTLPIANVPEQPDQTNYNTNNNNGDDNSNIRLNHISFLCFDIKELLHNMIMKIKNIEYIIMDNDSDDNDDDNDEYTISILQFMILIKYIMDIDSKLNIALPSFSQYFVELYHIQELQPIIDTYRKYHDKFIINTNNTNINILTNNTIDDIDKSNTNNNNNTIYPILIDQNSLLNNKISLIINKVLNDPIALTAGMIPQLYKKLCEMTPFLIDFKTRQAYYRHGCFDISRALYYIYQNNKSKLKELESSRIGKIHKKKIKVKRDKIIENAIILMETYAAKKSILEMEFENEEGTGIGPTLEYYAMVANEMKNPMHNFWRITDNNMIFPSPIDPFELKSNNLNKSKRRQAPLEKRRDFEKVQLIFRCLGTFLARAILDERIVDFPLHPVFWDLVLDRPVYIEDICKIDHNLGQTLLIFQDIINKKQEIEKDTRLTQIEKINKINDIRFKGIPIDDLALNFTFPGYDEIDFIENGENIPVTISNLDQYVSLLCRYYLYETNQAQIDAFKDGFNKVIPLKDLNIFKSEEIEYLICGNSRNEAWDIHTLQENIIPAHGYTFTSSSFRNLLKIMSGFTYDQKRAFLKFITGAERLPYGGFKNLNPKLTVVKKDPTQRNKSPDDYLPSVMTCQNYVKLPDYSSIDVMKNRLLYAMKEGQNSFNLSQTQICFRC